jgi:small GTP-binding protein
MGISCSNRSKNTNSREVIERPIDTHTNNVDRHIEPIKDQTQKVNQQSNNSTDTGTKKRVVRIKRSNLPNRPDRSRNYNQSNQSNQPKKINILLVGPPNSGKTCFINIIMNKYIKNLYEPTLLNEYSFVPFSSNDQKYNIQLLDTPGNIKSLSFFVKELNKTDCVLFIYNDSTNEQNVNNINTFAKNIDLITEKLDKINKINKFNHRSIKISVNNKESAQFEQISEQYGFYVADLKKTNNVHKLLGEIIKKINGLNYLCT